MPRPARAVAVEEFGIFGAPGGAAERELVAAIDNGFEHALTSHAGAAWARSPWEAAQRAAGDALRRLAMTDPGPRDWTASDDSPR